MGRLCQKLSAPRKMVKGKRNRAKRNVPAKQPSKKQKKAVATINQKVVAAQFQGPIPPPQILAGYENLLPGAADRIISMAEKETYHRQMMEKKALDSEINGLKHEASDTRRGQYCGLLIGITAILSGTYTSVNGYPWAGSFIGVGGVIGLVSAFIAGRNTKPSNDESQSTKEIVPAQKK